MVMSFNSAKQAIAAACLGNFKALGDVLSGIVNGEIYLSGAGAPTSTPKNIGARYFDTTNGVMYTATGTSSSANWSAGPSAIAAGLVTVTAATLLLSAAYHNKTVVLSKVDGLAVTLPAASGSGLRFRLVIGLATTSVGYTVATAPTTDIMAGVALGDDGDGEPANGWATAADTNKITLGGTSLASGGAVGDVIELEDIAAGVWAARLILTQGGTEVTPFSHV